MIIKGCFEVVLRKANQVVVLSFFVHVYLFILLLHLLLFLYTFSKELVLY